MTDKRHETTDQPRRQRRLRPSGGWLLGRLGTFAWAMAIALMAATAFTIASPLAPAPAADAATECLRIVEVQFNVPNIRDRERLNQEFVRLKNVCSETFRLTGWRLVDRSRNHQFPIPDATEIAGGTSLIVHSGRGRDRAGHLYMDIVGHQFWGNQEVEQALLIRPGGATADARKAPRPPDRGNNGNNRGGDAPTPTPEPTTGPDPTAEPTADPTREPAPDPTPEPTREPTPEPTPDPTSEPTPAPTQAPATPSPAPTAAPATPTPAPTATARPTASPAPTPTPTPRPTATPAPTPTPTPRPTASPAPTPSPTAPPAGNPAFGTRTASAPIVRSGGSSVLIENVSIDGGSVTSPSGIGISIMNVTGSITIRNVDLSDLVGGIYIYNSTGTLTIENVRGRNIGDGTIGSGHSNYIQLNQTRFSGVIRGNQFLGGRTEDMISLHRSGGNGVGAELVIENNRLQGLVADTSTARAWTSASGTGIIIGDGAGDSRNGNTIVRNNTLLTPGQVGIQHIDGPGIQTYGNVIYAEKRSLNNNSLTSWGGNPRGVVRDNVYCWTNNDGTRPAPWLSSYGSLSISNNRLDTGVDPASLRVALN